MGSITHKSDLGPSPFPHHFNVMYLKYFYPDLQSTLFYSCGLNLKITGWSKHGFPLSSLCYTPQPQTFENLFQRVGGLSGTSGMWEWEWGIESGVWKIAEIANPNLPPSVMRSMRCSCRTNWGFQPVFCGPSPLASPTLQSSAFPDSPLLCCTCSFCLGSSLS